MEARPYPIFLRPNVLVNLTTINQIDPYDTDSSHGGSEFPMQPMIPEPPPFNDSSCETYTKHGQQFVIVNYITN
jgi:hypothetical protein